MSNAMSNAIPILRANETQVYRISPTVDKYYETAELTRTEGKWPDELHFTTNNMRYVGKFIKHLQFGYGDGATHIDIFDDNGTEIRVNYSYEGNTSFREVANPKMSEINTELLDKMSKKQNEVKPLATLAKYFLPSHDIEVVREQGQCMTNLLCCSEKDAETETCTTNPICRLT